TLIAMMRAGIRTFWPSFEREAPRVSMIELGPVLVLLALCVGLTIQAGPAMRFVRHTTEQLAERKLYMDAVLKKPVVTPQASAAHGPAAHAPAPPAGARTPVPTPPEKEAAR